MKIKNGHGNKKHDIRNKINKGHATNPKELASCYEKKKAKERAEKLSTTSWYKCKFCKHYHIGRKQSN